MTKLSVVKLFIQFFLLPQSSTKISGKQNQQDLYYLALGVIVFQGEWVRMGPQGIPIFYEPNLIEFYEILDICELHLECSILVASNLHFKGKKAQESKRWTSLTYIQCTCTWSLISSQICNFQHVYGLWQLLSIKWNNKSDCMLIQYVTYQ